MGWQGEDDGVYAVPNFSTSVFFQAEDGIRDYKVTGVQTCCSSDLFPLQRGLPVVLIPVRERWAKQRLHRGKGHGLDTINNGATELAQRLQDALPIGNIAAIARDHSNQRRTIRTVKDSGVGREFVRSRRHVITEVADHVNGHRPRIEEKAAHDRRNRMGLELERNDNAEISTSAAERPKEIVVFGSAGGEHFAIGCDYLCRQQIVDRHPVFANQPANTTSESQATNTSLGHDATGNSKPEDMRFSINIPKSRSTLYSNSASRIIHENGSHSGQVDHQTVVAERTTAYVVPATTNSRRQIVRASEIDRGNHVSKAGASSDHPRMFADACIPDLTGLVVADIRWIENLTVKYRSERFDIDVGHGCERIVLHVRKCVALVHAVGAVRVSC